MYIFHYSCLILKYFGCVAQDNYNFGSLFELLTSWEINVFSDTRLVSRQNPAVKPNIDLLCAAKKAIQLSSRCSSPFSNIWDEGLQNIWRAYNSVLLFWSPKSESKNRDWIRPELPALQILSQFMALISSLRGPKIARSVSLERRFDFLQFLKK